MPYMNCGFCKKEFHVKPYQVGIRTWCSNTCKNEAHRIPKQCGNCKKEFWIYASQERKGLGQYCSKPCKDSMGVVPKPPKAVKEIVYKVCNTCEKTFKVSPSRKDTAKFCSKECKFSNEEFLAAASARSIGENSHRWKGGTYKHHNGYIAQKTSKNGLATFRLEHRNVMLQWMVEECCNHPFLIEINGQKRFAPEIEIHHIDRNRSNNVRDNLLAVTIPAHAKIHNFGSKPNPWECWPPNPTKW